jgi:hypothetical protein
LLLLTFPQPEHSFPQLKHRAFSRNGGDNETSQVGLLQQLVFVYLIEVVLMHMVIS